MIQKAAIILILLAASVAAADDFAFVQISDIHVSPHPVSLSATPELRGADCIAWLAEQTRGPQRVSKSVETPAPAFAIATGDLTEYGVIGNTWADFEHAFANLPCPLYVLPGNHDNTWVAMFHIMRKRYGGPNYSFDQHGIHFICLNSASPQEPVPSFDVTTRTFLTRDLERTPASTPVIVAMHHPPDSSEFANPVEYETLIDTLKYHNVVLMIYGHGHSVKHTDLDGIDGVMGGSTFGKNAGYGVVSIRGDELRYDYHYMHDPEQAGESESKDRWRKVLKKHISRQEPKRLFKVVFPQNGHAVEGNMCVVDLAFSFDRTANDADGATIVFKLDGEPVETKPQPSVYSDEAFHHAAMFSLEGVKPGGHLLTADAVLKDGRHDRRAITFYRESTDPKVLWRVQTEAAIKAAPVIAGHLLIVADTAGKLTAYDRYTGQSQWSFSTGGEILGAPAVTRSLLIFGSGDGKVYAVDDTGKERWNYEAGAPVYSPPLVDNGVAYVGDNAGCLHAINVETGKKQWIFDRADYAIEAAPIRWGDSIVFGAWDGYLYAVDRSTGKLAWKALGPKSRDGKAPRYYAPADCSPIVLGDALFVCDRGYQLGTYNRSGEFQRLIANKIAAIAADPSGNGFYTRSIEDFVSAFGIDGKPVWTTAIAAGRFPIPPTVCDGRLYICSNRGLLSVLDAETGKAWADYQATPGSYVMAPLAVSNDDICYAAAIDGTITALRFENESVIRNP